MLKVHYRLRSVETQQRTQNIDHDSSSSSPVTFAQLISDFLGGNSSADLSLENLRDIIMDFAFRFPRVSVDNEHFNLISFWHLKRNDEKLHMIHEIVNVVLAGAFTQVKVERIFSNFALVLTHLRNSLSGESLNSIIVTRDNIDLLETINFV
jgi:hAT family C-terminal dimerisation region